MNKKFNMLSGALALALGAGMAFAQTAQPPSTTSMPSSANPSSSTPSTTSPSGVAPATPATPAIPSSSGAKPATPATPATPASPALANRNDVNVGSFNSLDANHDSFLTQSEIMADSMLSTDFAKYDTNHDGKLSQAEYAAYRAQLARNRTPESAEKQR